MADDLDRLVVALVLDVLAVGLASGQAVRPLITFAWRSYDVPLCNVQ